MRVYGAMAEQISHKKSLKRVDNEKRKRLKEYYGLKKNGGDAERDSGVSGAGSENADSSGVGESSENVSESRLATPEENSTGKEEDIKAELENGNVDIKTRSLKELLQIQNVLLAEETEADNTIKNTIYDNYYDLIKVDDILREMSQLNSGIVDELRETCTMAQSLMKQ